MPRLLSKELTRLAFDAGAVGKVSRVVVEPGYNTVSEDAARFLESDPNFVRCVNDGFIVLDPEGDVEGTAAEERAANVEPDADADPREQREGESNTAYKKRMKALDEAAAEADKPRVDFLAQFNATDKAAQDAVYPTLSDEQKAWVDADRNATKGA